MKEFFTVREASAPDKLNKSPAWIRAGIKAGKIEGELLGPRMYVVRAGEIDRLKKYPITITRKEMFGLGRTK